MSKDAIKRVAALGAVAALAAAPAAFAAKPPDPGSQGAGHGQAGQPHGQSGQHGQAPAEHGNPLVTYVFKGTYAGNSSVDVKRGNARVRKANLVDTTVSFDLGSATIVASDTNTDQQVTLDDVAVGDKVVVKARLLRKEAGAQPYAAKQLVDQTQQPTS
jgi:hypothetical protein